ncbi:hypothetical protein CsSME_00044053 [Camellia sinensis var. sinensis]
MPPIGNDELQKVGLICLVLLSRRRGGNGKVEKLDMQGGWRRYKEEYPNNKFAVVVDKAIGNKWRPMMEAEKPSYMTMSEERKTEYNVFDGHGGKHAADFACNHLPRFIVKDEDFPREIERAVASAFLQTDTAFAEACSLNAALASGTTVLAALVVGRSGFFHPHLSNIH